MDLASRSPGLASHECCSLSLLLSLGDTHSSAYMFSFPQEAGELYNRMLKRFRQEKAVWIKYGAFLLRRGQAGASHRVLQRALECLPTKERECFFPVPEHARLSDIYQ